VQELSAGGITNKIKFAAYEKVTDAVNSVGSGATRQEGQHNL
jgi:hypothetical protein